MNIETTPFPELKTNRLLLRQLTINDSHEMMQIRSDELINKYLHRKGVITIEQAEAFIRMIETILKEKNGFYWAISLKDNPALIGTICYWNLSFENSTAEIGYELMSAYHGQGLMQEAIEKVIEYGFEVIKVKVITALPSNDNKNSVNLLEKNNFKRDMSYKYVSKEDAGEQAVYILVNYNNS